MKPSKPSPTLAIGCLVQVGDRMVVLATIQGLKWIEQGRMAPRRWWGHIHQVLGANASFEGANDIARIADCTLLAARTLMAKLPARVPIPLYKHQALHLVRELRKIGVVAEAIQIPVEDPNACPVDSSPS